MQKRILLDDHLNNAPQDKQISLYHVLSAGIFLSAIAAAGLLEIVYYSNTL